ncbi:hypothetical protein SAMN05216337_101789 [Bradyrhizobium brasilense]|uniref:Uncharacterized protein n=1 Tax=Bradyrhizobium brasilense TaxID=1419277 RepID=A0A1G6YTP1_9BRAD|nr:hypothetical protein [Bradyrhizobium brasilense]SDD93652.1 hypothetical protein SAMN05216337_101789 [Bradyrhizobium brasilense]
MIARINQQLLTSAVDYARRFKWGFENAAFGSDDWRCGHNLRAELDLDDNDDPMAYDEGPCDCPECDGASHRAWSKKLPLSIRVTLNLAGGAT